MTAGSRCSRSRFLRPRSPSSRRARRNGASATPCPKFLWSEWCGLFFLAIRRRVDYGCGRHGAAFAAPASV